MFFSKLQAFYKKRKSFKFYLLTFFFILLFFVFALGLLFLNLLGLKSFIEDGILSAFIGSIIIVLSAGVAGYLTYFELEYMRKEAADDRKASRNSTRLRATLDTIMTTELDNDFINAKVVFQKYANSKNQELEKLFARVYDGVKNNYVTKRDRTDQIKIRTFLNHFELVSLAMSKTEKEQEGNDQEELTEELDEKGKHNSSKLRILDEDFYKKWQGSSFIHVWNKSANAIGIMRSFTDNDNFYIEWEKVVKRWAPDYEKDVKTPKRFTQEELQILVASPSELKDEDDDAPGWLSKLNSLI